VTTLIMAAKETNSTGATQNFSANHKTSSEQKNLSLFLSDQSKMKVKSDWELNELQTLIGLG